MASKIEVDEIMNAGGDNDTGIDLATNDQILLKVANATRLTMNSTGQTTIVGEGGTTTTSVQQGLAKVWINFEGDGTIADSDSLNVSGLTDRGTGEYTITIANDMANATYSVTGSGTHDSGSYIAWCCISHDTGLAAGSCPTDYMDNGATARDVELACTTIHGELA